MRETKRSDDSLTVLHYLKEEMESKEGELLALNNELQGSTALKAEMDSQSAWRDSRSTGQTSRGHDGTIGLSKS